MKKKTLITLIIAGIGAITAFFIRKKLTEDPWADFNCGDI